MHGVCFVDFQFNALSCKSGLVEDGEILILSDSCPAMVLLSKSLNVHSNCDIFDNCFQELIFVLF